MHSRVLDGRGLTEDVRTLQMPERRIEVIVFGASRRFGKLRVNITL